MGRCLRKCRVVSVAGDVDLALLDAETPAVPLTRSRSRSRARTHPHLRPRKPPSREPSTRSSSSAPAALDRTTTVLASGPPEISAASAVCCSSNGSCQLAVEVSETFEVASVHHNSLSHPRRAEEMVTTATSTPPPERSFWGRRGVTAPTEAEIEEFLAGREAEIRKRFTEKYNFDVEKDVPLEGRYEWVRLLPESPPPPSQKQQQAQPVNSS